LFRAETSKAVFEHVTIGDVRALVTDRPRRDGLEVDFDRSPSTSSDGVE
jgi:hypothetical protein